MHFIVILFLFKLNYYRIAMLVFLFPKVCCQQKLFQRRFIAEHSSLYELIAREHIFNYQVLFDTSSSFGECQVALYKKKVI